MYQMKREVTKMTKYYVFHCNNGFCGCDEDFYKKVDEKENLDELAEEILFNEYSFTEPDGRLFIDDKSFTNEITEEEYEEYLDNLTVDYEEITKEEYGEYNIEF